MEVLDASTAIEGVDRGCIAGDIGGVGGDLLIGGEQLAAVDGIGTGAADLTSSHIGDLPFCANAADTDHAGGCCPGKGVSDAADGCPRGGDCRRRGAVGAECNGTGVTGCGTVTQGHRSGCGGTCPRTGRQGVAAAGCGVGTKRDIRGIEGLGICSRRCGIHTCR